MLMKIDKILNTMPSVFINYITGGWYGSSMCARLYLYNKYVSNRNYLVRGLLLIIDGIEKNHCLIAAKIWRRRFLRNGDIYFPAAYSEFLTENKSNEN